MNERVATYIMDDIEFCWIHSITLGINNEACLQRHKEEMA